VYHAGGYEVLSYTNLLTLMIEIVTHNNVKMPPMNPFQIKLHNPLHETFGKPLPKELKQLQHGLLQLPSSAEKVDYAEANGLIMPKTLRPETAVAKSNIQEVQHRLLYTIQLNGSREFEKAFSRIKQERLKTDTLHE
jgi:hypothetical protein